LLDNTNKVILVGNPMHHPRIKEMYMGQLRDCNNKPEVEVMNEPEGKRKE
jgi:hypothetical protein